MNWKRSIGFAGLLLATASCSGASQENVDESNEALAPYWLKADWSIPKVFGLDRNGDGLVDLAPPKEAYTPQSYRVTVDACSAAPPRGTVTSFLYELTFPDHVDRQTTTSCSIVYTLPASTPSYLLRITASVSDGTAGVREFKIAPRNFIIVSMGDSIASGEGNPDVPGSNARWVDTRCHRSANSGPARAAREIEDSDPHTSVTFLSVACSGAGITRGILGEYAGQDPGGNRFNLEPQLVQVNRALCPVQRTCAPSEMPKIDVLLLQAGANDIQFGEIARRCAYPVDDCRSHIPSGFQSALNALPGLYDQLGRQLTASLNVGLVHTAEYPDPTTNDSGGYCDSIFRGAVDDNYSTAERTALGAIGGFLVGGIAGEVIAGVLASGLHDGEITPAENQWAQNSVVLPLNQVLQAAAQRNRWGISNVRAQFLNHGYCANNHFIVRYDESKATQGNIDGSLHPNAAGQQIYASAIVSATSVIRLGATPTPPPDGPLAGANAWGYLWSQEITGTFAAAASYTRSSLVAPSDNRNPTVSWQSTGSYLVQFPKLGAYPGGNVQVTAYGYGSEHCKVAGWAPSGDTMNVYVKCFDVTGVPVNSMFTASFISKFATGGGVNGYLWADQPQSGSYTPHRTFQYNATGAVNTVQRNSVGIYTATFPGLFVPGGTVEVTAYGSGNEACKVGNWTSNSVTVRCFNPAGSPVDTPYSLRFGSSDFSGGNSYAYAWAEQPSSPSYTPSPSYQSVFFNNSCVSVPSSITISRASLGTYKVNVPQLASTGSTVKVTAYGSSSDTCKIATWGAGAGNSTQATVVCHNAAGALVDSLFVFTYLTDQFIRC